MKVTTTSKHMQCDEAIKCVFDLNKLDINVYKKLKKMGEARADEIASYLEKERSTVYRSLQKLTDAGICKKKRKILEQGGYYHVYECNDVADVQRKANECLDSWYSTIKATLQLLSEE